MKSRGKYYIFALSCFLILGFILRIISVNHIPLSLNPDEAALGYNALSISKTLSDEHGTLLPISLKSFGDWKLPVYSYIDAFFIDVFYPLKLAVRLPSILAGTISIFLIYLISLKLFKNKPLAIMTGFFLAINPWSIFFSRGAYEVNVGLTFFLSGLYLLLVSQSKKDFILFLSFLSFGISMFSHHVFIVFTPLYVITVLLLQRKEYKKTKSFWFGILFFLIIVIISFSFQIFSGDKKVSNLNVFNDRGALYRRAENLRGDGSSENKFFEKILYNKYYAGSYQFLQNYFKSYSPEFLFDKGGDKLAHNIGEVGYFYIFDGFLFMIGAFFMIWRKEKKALYYLIPWIFIAPIPSAVTREISGTRLCQMVPAIILVSSYGCFALLSSFKGKKRITIGFLLALIVGISFSYFYQYYFVHFNTQRIRFWNYGFEEAVKITNNYPDYRVVVRGPENFPYIYFLLYNKYDPAAFREQVEYYPENNEGFLYVKSFGRYSFVPRLQDVVEEEGTIYFDDQNFNEGDNLIKLPNGDPVLKYYFGKTSK